MRAVNNMFAAGAVLGALFCGLFPGPVWARDFVGGELVMGGTDTVYYVGTNLKRYVFSNERVYKSWYANFNAVIKLSTEELNALPLAGVVTYRPGSRMIKIPDDPKVYAVAGNGLVRHVTTEEIARALYGVDWNKKIDDLSASFFVGSYHEGSSINAITEFDPAAYLFTIPSISADKGLLAVVPLPAPEPKPEPAPAPMPVTLGAIASIQFAPSDSSVVYLTSADAAVGAWKSKDGGATWKRIYTGGALGTLAVNATSPDILLLADAGKIKRSADGGATWFSVTSTPANFGNVLGLSFATNNPNLAYATSLKSFIKSEDGGLTWTTVSGLLDLSYTYNTVLRVHPQDDNLVFAGSTKGIQISTFGGASWLQSTSSTKHSNPVGSEFLNVTGFDFNTKDAFFYYMTTDQGLWYTGDNGSSWNTVRVGDVGGNEFAGIEAANTENSTVYLGTKKGVWKSVNYAREWSEMDGGIDLKDIQTLAVDPKNPNSVFAGTRDQGANVVAGEGLYRTTDGGITWSKVTVFN